MRALCALRAAHLCPTPLYVCTMDDFTIAIPGMFSYQNDGNIIVGVTPAYCGCIESYF